MQEDITVESELNIFNKLIIDLENIKVTLMMKIGPCCYCFSYLILSLISKKLSWMEKKLSLVKVLSTLNSKEFNERNEQMTFVSGERLLVWGKQTKKNNYHEKKKSKSLFRNSGNMPNIICDRCKKEYHIRILCPERQNG